MPDTAPSVLPTPKVETVSPPEGVFAIYTNHAGVTATQSEVRLLLGEIVQGTPEKVQVLQRAHVIMSWVQAKVVARLLQDYIDAYEKFNGSLQPPKLPAQVFF